MGRFDARLLVCVTTLPSRDQAEEVARRLVAEELVVCAQVGAELTSFYRWQGEVQGDQEVAVALKVTAERHDQALSRLRELHPYEVPQLVSWVADRVDEGYGRWAWGEQP